MKIAVVHGGHSPEAEASTTNAISITQALIEAGHEARMVEFCPEALIHLPGTCDMVFVEAQGKYHGDGTCQAVCEFLRLPYTGTRAAEAAVINDKALSKLICSHLQCPTAPFVELTRADLACGNAMAQIEARVGFPAVAKPNTQGGSFGITHLRDASDVQALGEAFEIDDTIIVEKYLRGTFVTAAVIEVDGEIRVLPLLTADTDDDAPVKLFVGQFSISPADLPPAQSAHIEELSRTLFRGFRARGYARIDYIIEEETGIPHFLEINAIPGLRPKSFFPYAAELAGLDVRTIVAGIVREGHRHAEEK